MWKISMLRELVKRKLSLAVEDVFELFEKTIVEYEEANERRHRALLEAVLKPRLRLQRAGSQGSENEEIQSEEPPSKKRKARKRTSPLLKRKARREDDETVPPQGDHLAPISDVSDFTDTKSSEDDAEKSLEAEKKGLDTPTVTKPADATKSFTCSLCKKFFRTRDCLIAHIRDHTMGKIVSPFSAKKEEKPSTSVKTPPSGKIEVQTSAKKEEKPSASCKNPLSGKIEVPLIPKNEVKASGSVKTLPLGKMAAPLNPKNEEKPSTFVKTPPPTADQVTPKSLLVVSYSKSPANDPKTTKLKILNALQRLSNVKEHPKENPSEDNKQSQLAKFAAILQNDTPTSNPSDKNGKLASAAIDANQNTAKEIPNKGEELPSPSERSSGKPENDVSTSDSSDSDARAKLASAAKNVNENTNTEKPTEGKELPPQPGKSDANPENDDQTSDSSDGEPTESARPNVVIDENPDTRKKQDAARNHGVLQKFYTVKTPGSGTSAAQANGEEPLSEPESLFAPLSHSDMTPDSSGDEASNRDGKKQFACSQCRKTFLTQALLENHLTAHKEGGAFACSFCDKKYFKAGFFKRHMRLHADGGKEDKEDKEDEDGKDGEKTKKKKKSKHCKHKCDHCGKEFMHSSLLAGHLVVHEGETEQSKAGL